jgi:HAMP domain-containing protein
MQVRSEIRSAVATLLLLQLLSTFGAIGVLSRMTPEIGRILTDNVRSIEAAESMLASMARVAPSPGLADKVSDFEAALQAARGNVTEEAEELPLATIDQHWRAAMNGDPVAREQTIAAIQELASINHASMEAADRRAERLGTNGAWAAVVLAILCTAVSIFVVNRVTRSVVTPMEMLRSFAVAVRNGDLFRRAPTDLPTNEFNELASAINRLVESQRDAVRHVDLHAANVGLDSLARMLELVPGPAWVLDSHDQVLRMNAQALDIMGTEAGLVARERIGKMVRTGDHGDFEDEHLVVLRSADGLWLAALRSSSPGATSVHGAHPEPVANEQDHPEAPESV